MMFIHYLQGLPEYVQYWNKIQSDQSNYIFPSVEKALNHLYSTPKVVLYADKLRVSSYFNQNRSLPPIKQIISPKSTYKGLLFPKNSPLTSSFKIFGAMTAENGVQVKLLRKWFGAGVPELDENNATALSFSHFVLCFGVFTIILVVSLFLLCGEKCMALF